MDKRMKKHMCCEIIGIGVDIENIERFRAQQKNERLLKKIFTKKELEYCASKTDPAPHLTARFAAKEAVFKALQKDGKTKIDYLDIEIDNRKDGQPEVHINKQYFYNLDMQISLSHTTETAIAFVLICCAKNSTEENK
ncbi:MAG: holo-ACP synthase [Candidatus Micrarchaeota archaeon]